VHVGRLRVAGLLFPLIGLFPLVSLAACTGPDASIAERADAAVPSYAAPSAAPGFCAELAGTTHLTDLPVAVGTLTADPQDVEAGLALSAAIDELKAVLDEVRDAPDFAALGTSLEELVAALREAREGSLTDDVRTAIRSGLDRVGHLVQPACDYPT
jgi:hypothetical protein